MPVEAGGGSSAARNGGSSPKATRWSSRRRSDEYSAYSGPSWTRSSGSGSAGSVSTADQRNAGIRQARELELAELALVGVLVGDPLGRRVARELDDGLRAERAGRAVQSFAGSGPTRRGRPGPRARAGTRAGRPGGRGKRSSPAAAVRSNGTMRGRVSSCASATPPSLRSESANRKCAAVSETAVLNAVRLAGLYALLR